MISTNILDNEYLLIGRFLNVRIIKFYRQISICVSLINMVSLR
jgi:hypothetical protein